MKADIKGLTKLARALAVTPRKNFAMGVWLEDGHDCGTKRCIAGQAALVFPHRFKKVGEWVDDQTGVKEYAVQHRASGYTGSFAFAKAFKITEEQAEELTMEGLSHKSTPKAAAKAVMALVDKLKKAMKK